METKYSDIVIPQAITDKWQKTVNLMADLFEVPVGLIMKAKKKEIEVFITSNTKDNPYKKHDKAKLNTGMYCEEVLATETLLEVPNALISKKWNKNPGDRCYDCYQVLADKCGTCPEAAFKQRCYDGDQWRPGSIPLRQP